MRASLALERESGQRLIDIQQLVSVDVDQFYGIEIEEFPAQIAQVALWLVDHQMNVRISEEFGNYFARIPLVSTPHIVHGNALRVDWNDVLPAEKCSYVLGNPPFVGAMVMSDAQREDFAAVFSDLKGYGVLDFVSAWYWKAAKYMQHTAIHAAFVSTNSIMQGEQVGLLWAPLMQRLGIHIAFAHRTFRWSNEAKGVAAVHCVIVGFGCLVPKRARLFEYEIVEGEAHEVGAMNINAYLVDAPDVFLINRDAPICAVPAMRFGSMPRDGGHLILDEASRDAFLSAEPEARRWIRFYTEAQEFINGYTRYCLWLVDIDPAQLRNLPEVMKRIERVRTFRLESKAQTTRNFAATPTLFCQIAQPRSGYLLIPRVSSERRRFVPMNFMDALTIANDQVLTVESATMFHFGILTSTMHNAWIRYTCGRLKSDFRYSKDIVYNNFPWPDAPTDTQKRKIETAAQGVLGARTAYPKASLADLYDPLTMPPNLVKAHQVLDAAVDAAYGKEGVRNDAERVAFLFELYQKYTSLLPGVTVKKRGKRSKTAV